MNSTTQNQVSFVKTIATMTLSHNESESKGLYNETDSWTTYNWSEKDSLTENWVTDAELPANSSKTILTTEGAIIMQNMSGSCTYENSPNILTNFIFQGVLLTVIGAIGVVGNMSGIFHFIKLERPLKFHWLMATLFIFQTVFIVTAFIIFALPTLDDEYKSFTHMLVGPKILPFLQIAMTGSLYCQVAFTIERYLVVCHPFYIVSKEWSVWRYILPLVAFSIVYNIPKFFELDTYICESSLKHEEHKDVMPHQVNGSYYVPTSMRKHDYYKHVYLNVMNVLFMLVGPFLVLIILNGLTLMNLRRYQCRQRRESTFQKYGVDSAMLPKFKSSKDISGSTSRSSREVILAKISLVIVVTSIFVHSVKWVPTIYEFVNLKGYECSTWIRPFEHVSHFLLVLDSSISFYIYSFTRPQTVFNKLASFFSRPSFKYGRKLSTDTSSKPYQYSVSTRTESHRFEMSRQDTMIVKPMLSNND